MRWFVSLSPQFPAQHLSWSNTIQIGLSRDLKCTSSVSNKNHVWWCAHCTGFVGRLVSALELPDKHMVGFTHKLLRNQTPKNITYFPSMGWGAYAPNAAPCMAIPLRLYVWVILLSFPAVRKRSLSLVTPVSVCKQYSLISTHATGLGGRSWQQRRGVLCRH